MAGLLGSWWSHEQQLVQGPPIASASCMARRELLKESMAEDHLRLRACRLLRSRLTLFCWDQKADDTCTSHSEQGLCEYSLSESCWPS